MSPRELSELIAQHGSGIVTRGRERDRRPGRSWRAARAAQHAGAFFRPKSHARADDGSRRDRKCGRRDAGGRQAFNEKRPPNFTSALRPRGDAWEEPSEVDADRLDDAYRSGEF
jgi:hypothetical protein